MIQLRRLKKIKIIPIFISIGLASCKPELKPGYYSGVLFRSNIQESLSENVRTEILFDRAQYGQMKIRNLESSVIETIEAKWNRKTNRIKFKINSLNLALELAPETLFKTSNHMYCYHGEQKYKVNFCVDKDEFSLNIVETATGSTSLSLSGLFDSQQKPLSLEAPKKFTRAEAIQIAFSKSFDQKIEFEILQQTKQKARVAFLNLLPHLNFKDLFAISSLAPKTIATFTADFVPFLLPTRWFQKNEAQALFSAEQFTLDILRADLAYGIESMGYLLDRDQANAQFYREEREKLAQLSAQVSKIGKTEFGQMGTLGDELQLRLSLVDNFVQQDKNRLENAIGHERTSLAIQMGFNNPDVVQDFDVQESQNSIEDAQPLNADHLMTIALQRSLELKQFDELIINAENQKKEWYFNWMDPDLPAGSAVSLSVIPNLERASAVVGEIVARRNKIAAQIKINAKNAVINFNNAIELYQITEVGIRQLKTREDLILMDIEKAQSTAGLHTNAAATQYALSTYFQFKLKQNDAIAAFRVAQAQIRRILFDYYYTSKQPPHSEAAKSSSQKSSLL